MFTIRMYKGNSSLPSGLVASSSSITTAGAPPVVGDPTRLPLPQQQKLSLTQQQHLVLLLHARRCGEGAAAGSSTCTLPRSCAAMKTVLQHMRTCSQGATCTYRNCASSAQLLHHWTHCKLANCGICKPLRSDNTRVPAKRIALAVITPNNGVRPVDHSYSKVIKPVLPHKTSRGKEGDEDEEEVHNAAPVDARDAGSQRELARRPVMILPRPDLKRKAKQDRMELVLHANRCPRRQCAWDKCLETKQQLLHISSCVRSFRSNCEYPFCTDTKLLMLHYRNCKPEFEQCETCFKRPPPPYKGKDYFAELATDVLRNITRYLAKDVKSLNALKQVNKRVYSFFQLAGEIKGLYSKITYSKVYVEQLANGAIGLHFANSGISVGGYMHLITRNGVEEIIEYKASKNTAVIEHVKSNYGGPILSGSPMFQPIPLPNAFYDAFALALQKFDFTEIRFNSVVLDMNEFNNFFLNRRHERNNEIHLATMKMKFDNVRFV